mmetsp:Transcript_11154/g.25333  ORF Transcript_11154/g.25333 Transcript_11154/m.25333 type:complete len:668 (-) Transcript_11154:37-2040(-)
MAWPDPWGPSEGSNAFRFDPGSFRAGPGGLPSSTSSYAWPEPGYHFHGWSTSGSAAGTAQSKPPSAWGHPSTQTRTEPADARTAAQQGAAGAGDRWATPGRSKQLGVWPTVAPGQTRGNAPSTTGPARSLNQPSARSSSSSSASSSSSSSSSDQGTPAKALPQASRDRRPDALKMKGAAVGQQKPQLLCAGCAQPISGQYVEVDGKIFHHPCFKCKKCKQKISGKYVKTKEEEGFLCWDCQPRCSACKGPLAGGAVINVDGMSLHASCFRCSECSEPISDVGHYKVDDAVYQCASCHAKAWKANEDAEQATAMKRERRMKRQNSSAYGLYWRPEIVPSSQQTLLDMGVPGHRLTPPASKVCVCRDPSSGTVSCALAPSFGQQDASVNVSYLATALRILTSHGREPQFSLDPTDPHNISGDLQVKRFYPSWLASTVVGEVLFQADYALKQICLGDMQLPGLPNALDGWNFNEGQEVAARQWFVIRKGWVTVSRDGAIVPHCEMGVEARRLVPGSKGYEDAAYTDPSEPMVRMAAAISEGFTWVAEQLPVVGELLSLAKALVLARFLLETGSSCNSAVVSNFPQPRCPEGDAYRLEIPTLRMERRTSQVQQTGSQLVMQRQTRCIYGGVDLGVPGAKVRSKPLAQVILEPDTLHVKLPLFAQHGAAMAA